MTQSLTAIVTGAGSGVGRAAALALQANGFSVVLAGRRKAQLEETASLKAATGGQMRVVATDVSDPDSVEAAFLEAKEAFGRIDLLFNNAGIDAPVKPIDELTVQEWKAVIDINLTGAFPCARQAVKMMKAQDPNGGRIINNGSVAAYVPRPNSAPYACLQTRHYGFDQIYRPGWAGVQHRLQPDRHWQCRQRNVAWCEPGWCADAAS